MTPEEEFEAATNRFKKNRGEIKLLEEKLVALKKESFETKNDLRKAWINSRKRVRLTKDVHAAFFGASPILDRISLPREKKDKSTYSEMSLSKYFLSPWQYYWTSLDTLFPNYSSQIMGRSPLQLFQAGREFVVFKIVKSKTTIPYYIFSEDPLKQTDYNGKYSLVTFPFSEATQSQIAEIKSPYFPWISHYQNYELTKEIKNNKITHLFLIIPNDFLEEVV